jgi:hypothetical protein
MYVYIFLILFWFLATQLIANRKLQSIICGILLFLVMGLRHPSIGADTQHYIYKYLSVDISEFVFSNSSEIGYLFFNYSLYQFGVSPQLYLLITSAIISFAISYFFYNYSKSIFFSFYLFLTIGLFTMSLSGIRQMISISFALLAFVTYNKPMKFRYLVSIFFMILAYSFHNSSIVFIVIYFIRNIKLTKNRAIYLMVAIVTTIFFRESLASIIEYLSPSKYEDFEYLSNTHKINPLIIFVSFLIPLTSLFILDVRIKQPKISQFFILSNLNFFTNILSLNSNLLGRLGFYFNPFNMILIPNTIFSIKDKKLRIFFILLFFILPFFQMLLVFPGVRGSVGNYIFFWQ